MTTTVPVVTIDGPSGSGKGTISALAAKYMGYHLLDSGALYRLTALAAMQAYIDLDQQAAVADVARHLDVTFDAASQAVLLNGADVTQAIRAEDVGMNASKVAVYPAVRDALLVRQRAFLQMPGLVADGRDMGTAIFPEAPVKIYLTASAEARAQRRYKQLLAKGESVSLRPLLEDIRARDERDMNREVSPLMPAEDAIIIDSTDIGIDEVLKRVLAVVV